MDFTSAKVIKDRKNQVLARVFSRMTNNEEMNQHKINILFGELVPKQNEKEHRLRRSSAEYHDRAQKRDRLVSRGAASSEPFLEPRLFCLYSFQSMDSQHE